MYLMETLQIFKPDIDPEYYRVTSLDGQDRCLYSWGTAIAIGARVSRDEPRPFSMQKLVAPGDSLLFEDTIYSSNNAPPPYIVESGKEILPLLTAQN
jgi:hypothetical protein